MSSTNSFIRQNDSLGHLTRRRSRTSLQLDPSRPIYSLYGHSVRNVNPDLTAFPPQPPKPPSDESSSRGSSPFDPSRIGIPLPINCNYTNLYSSSGFDLMRALAYVVNRPNPQIDIGPVDTSTALVVVDARKPDLPIIHVSASFSVLTGYEDWEICGRNCRVLQSPPNAEPITKGSKRKYSDPTAAYHMKAHIMAGKESQSSIVNYRKNGEPFVNLVTVIPITWGSDEIAYYIGFQVDLLQQPNAILSHKAHGTYMTHHNMSTKVQERIVPLPEEASRIEEINLPPAPLQPAPRGRPPLQIQASVSNPHSTAVPDIQSLRSDFKTVLNENRDLVMVVSLKGTLFYVSAACQSMLGYEEDELVNQNISSFCHTGDLTGVLRQLKEAGNTAHTPIDMIFRAVAKSRTFWMEAQGQLHVEAGKGRKYVVLVGRERILAPLSWAAIYSRGGLGDREFWTKLSLDGMCLYSTASVREVLGFSSDAMLGKMMSRMAPVAQQAQIMKAIRDAWSGSIVITLAVSLTSRDGGVVECMADFYPPRLAPLSQLNATSADSDPMSGPSSSNSAAVPPVVYCQINEIASANRRAMAMPSPSASPLQPLSNQVPASDGLTNSSLVLANPVNQTSRGSETCLIKSLPATGNTFAFSESKDNVFNELDTSKKTAWKSVPVTFSLSMRCIPKF
ncbi:hypothetical protein CROQUDRAFT_46715 [Cronartium quercuum f. sp. fusiforme G11]|uniref:PAS domain-containing protein n=1 Tax=Cronartium quercuum f. sp. fusiforme G11 TaxID=708437 RepID=A0A9P6TAP4_9BASI|nr:hypothetical protein CROQUDRAFT_46715 [Cronartium quercuum f. sp. fusiforme G11]